ncbi:MAG: hypothetical protein QM734_10410 [Cyclobacteriaceae bacterium]
MENIPVKDPFSIQIPSEFINDSLTFSIIGYTESSKLIKELVLDKAAPIHLKEKETRLKEVVIIGEKLVTRNMELKKEA